ncbi:MutS protein msh4 [Coemansia sp. RSA 678]|nr:MutS protein msh4 [Coemansia sp. RSA 678]
MSEIVDLTELGSDSSCFYPDNSSYSDDEVYIVDVRPPDKKPRLEDLYSEHSDTEVSLQSMLAPTSAYAEVSGTPNTLLVLAEGRGFASEIAYCLFNIETSQCTLSQFADSASYSRTIYAIVTSRPQIVFVPKAMAAGKSKAMINIRRYLPWLTIVPFERKRFNDAEGAQVDLGLEDCGSSDDKRERSLFSAIDHTNTKMGSRLLRANILQPSTDLSTIYARQTAVLELLDTEELFFSLSAQLVDMPDIDAAITSLIRISQATTSRQSRVDDLLDHIHAVIREDIGMEKSAQMTRSQRCHAVKDGVDGFLDVSRAIFDKVTHEVVELVEQCANETQVPIRAVYRPSAGYIMNAKRSDIGETIPEEFVNVVIKKQTVKLNNRLASVVIEINLLTEKAIQRVADVIRENITILYRVSEAVALLDMIVSFAHHCTLHNCVVPEFSDSINIIQGRHPVLEAVGREVVPNNVSTVSATFTVVSGPNMGGKSTYLRQIIYMAIMAQIGCLVPAQSATLKVFDKLFVRMNNNDNMSASESTFLREMHDIAYILQNYDQHSLLLIDELGRSTATSEGKAICRAVCEELLQSTATVFLTTHFLDLPEVLGTHFNCSQVVLSAVTEDNLDGMRFKATFGTQRQTLYGIRLAEQMGFPDEVIDIAEQVADEVSI